MVKQQSKPRKQKTAKTTTKTTKSSRKEHIKQSTVSTFWVVLGIILCVVIVVLTILAIDWLVYRHNCEKRVSDIDPENSALIGPTQEQAEGCNNYSLFFLKNN